MSDYRGIGPCNDCDKYEGCVGTCRKFREWRDSLNAKPSNIPVHDKSCILHSCCQGKCTCDYEKRMANQLPVHTLIDIAELTALRAERDRYKEKHNNTSDLYTVAIDRIIALESDRDSLLETVKLTYRKHCMGDDKIGWEELDTALLDTLCESMGDEVFCDWTTNTRKELDK